MRETLLEHEAEFWGNFSNLHNPQRCAGQEACPIHNPSNHHMRGWAMLWRGDRGILERLCPEHGVGHPDPDQVPFWRATNQMWQYTHGCCGCCYAGGVTDEV